MFICKFFIKLFKHIKYQKIINQAYKREQLISKISTVLGVQFKLDWIDRLYAVINPNIKDGQYNPEQIYEFDVNGNLYNNEWITKWVMERMNIVRDFITTQNLFEVIEYDIRDLGNLNYLIVFQSITLSPVLRYAKYAVIELGIILCILLGLWIWL